MMNRTTPNSDNPLEAVGDIWAILALIFLAMFIGILSLLVVQGPTDLSDELARENAQIAEALSSAAHSVEDAKSQLAQAQNNLSAKEQELSNANGKIKSQQSRADAAEDAVTQAQAEVASAQRRADSATNRAAEAERKLATKALEVVFAVDDSGSMSDEHKRLGPDQKILAEALSPLAPLSVGAIAYLKDRRTFGLTPITSPDSDGGRSLGALNRFVDSYQAKGGNVDLIAAARESMAMLNRSKKRSAKRTIVILSDVSVYETRNDNEASQIIRELGGWVQSSPRHALLVIFTGDKTKDRDFYRRLKAAGGPRVTISENPSDMLPELLRAMTSR